MLKSLIYLLNDISWFAESKSYLWDVNERIGRITTILLLVLPMIDNMVSLRRAIKNDNIQSESLLA